MNTPPTIEGVRAKLEREGALFAADEVRCLLEQSEDRGRQLMECQDSFAEVEASATRTLGQLGAAQKEAEYLSGRYVQLSEAYNAGLARENALQEQYEDLREKLAIEEQERADFEASQARLLEQLGALQNGLHEALDIIVWMSGSDDFAPNGEAIEGWQKARDQLDQLFLLAGSNPASTQQARVAELQDQLEMLRAALIAIQQAAGVNTAEDFESFAHVTATIALNAVRVDSSPASEPGDG